MWRKVVHLGVQANRVLGQLLGAHIGFLRSLTATLSVHPVVPLRGLLDNATPGIWNLPWTSLTRVSTPSISDRCQCPPLCCCKKWRGGSFESQPHATRIRFPMPKAWGDPHLEVRQMSLSPAFGGAGLWLGRVLKRRIFPAALYSEWIPDKS